MTDQQANSIEHLCAIARRARADGDQRLMLWAQDEIASVAAEIHRARWASLPGAA
jgi:hypothetical protein